MRHFSTRLGTQVHTSARTCRRADAAPPTAGEQAHSAMHAALIRHAPYMYPSSLSLKAQNTLNAISYDTPLHVLKDHAPLLACSLTQSHSVSPSLTQACSDSHAAHASLT